LEPNLNKNCENKDFHTKLSEYEKSKYQVTHDLQNHYDTWNPQTIDALQSFYAKNAAAIWRVEV